MRRRLSARMPMKFPGKSRRAPAPARPLSASAAKSRPSSKAWGAESEAQRLRDMGRAEAEKIELAARAEIDAAGRTARIELKVLGARLAVERAEVLLKQELAPKSEAALIRTFIAELEGSVN